MPADLSQRQSDAPVPLHLCVPRLSGDLALEGSDDVTDLLHGVN